MVRWFLPFTLFTMYWTILYTHPRYPVDISYLVADLKYSQEHGLKICEVQHGALSAVDGDLYISGGEGSISPLIADFCALFSIEKWATGLMYAPLKKALEKQKWKIMPSLKALLNDSFFLEHALLNPLDPSCITSYQGIVYADFDIVHNAELYRQTYPGIIFMNAATMPYWRDKFKMNELFKVHDELTQYKADWRMYPKKYDPFLSQRIREEMPAEWYVIKPRSEVLAKGVIVIANRDLDKVLQQILEPGAPLEKHPDRKYAYWFKNTDNTFLIEKYYASDYIYCSHPIRSADETKYHYDATMRIAFILQYNKGKMTYHGLGGFWKLPSKAIEEEATLNERTISYCKPPFYQSVEPALLKEVDGYMERAMLLLYEGMLKL